MKRFLIFSILGGALFTLLVSHNTFATSDYLPSTSDGIVDLEDKDGFSRSATADGSTSLLLGCRFSRVGAINFFPLTAYTNNGQQSYTTTPCGYNMNNGELVGAFNYDYHFRYNYGFSVSNGRTTTAPVWYNQFINSLSNTSYPAFQFVSAFDRFSLTQNFSTPSQSGWLTVPVSSEDGYNFLIYTLTNLNSYGTTVVAPTFLNSDSDIYIDNINNGSHTKQEIRDIINNSGYAGWVYTDSNNQKTSTIFDCSDQDDCVRLLPEGETLSALTDYLDLLEDGTYFAIYALPRFTDASYSLYNPTFGTPSSLSTYNVDFDDIDENAYWGMPFVYSTNYVNTYGSNPPIYDLLHEELFASYISYLYIQPDTPEAFVRSRTFAGQLVASHNNSIRYMNGLSQIQPNPGDNMWGNIFNLGNIIFPFQSFLSGFTNQQCVDIPIIGSWLGSGSNSRYCSWWSSDIRDVLTPIFATSSMMLLFGFIMKWLRSDSSKITIKEEA